MHLPPAPATQPGTTWFLGLDLTQRQDFTALNLIKNCADPASVVKYGQSAYTEANQHEQN